MSIKKIAEILNTGGICMIPTDSKYMLASAYHCPASVQKLSQIQMENTENEMSFVISSMTQLLPVRHLIAQMVWDFIDSLWPGPIGLVLSKQDCSMLDSCGNIVLYISDCAVTSYLIGMVGPIAVKPLGNMRQIQNKKINTKLSGKIDGILLDLPHEEDYEITVVDCTQIKMGIISVMQTGSVPSIQIMDTFHAILSKHTDCVSHHNAAGDEG
ncbi:uncharacterized protein O3C94_012742 [Discoglossus pictus]